MLWIRSFEHRGEHRHEKKKRDDSDRLTARIMALFPPIEQVTLLQRLPNVVQTSWTYGHRSLKFGP